MSVDLIRFATNTAVRTYNQEEIDALIADFGWILPPVIDSWDPAGGLPVAPSDGDRYIAESTAAGWTEGYIYEWDDAGGVWVESDPPEEGWMVWLLLDLVFWVFFSGGWMEVGSDSFWTLDTNQAGITGNKSGSFDFATTGYIGLNVAAETGKRIKITQTSDGGTTWGIHQTLGVTQAFDFVRGMYISQSADQASSTATSVWAEGTASGASSQSKGFWFENDASGAGAMAYGIDIRSGHGGVDNTQILKGLILSGSGNPENALGVTLHQIELSDLASAQTDPTAEHIGIYLYNTESGTDANMKKWTIYNASTDTTSGKMFLGFDNVKTYWGTSYDSTIYFDGSGFVINPDENSAGYGLLINGNIVDASYITSIDPNNRILYDSGGSAFVNWETYTFYDSLGVSSADTENRYLYDSLGNLAMDWSADGSISFDNNNLTTTGKISYNEADWTGGNVIYVPLTGDIETYVAAATAGDTLQLASGTYTLPNTLSINTRVHIRGAGRGATKLTYDFNSGSDAIESFAANTEISNLSIELTGSSGGVGITTSQDIYVHDVSILLSGTGGTQFVAYKQTGASYYSFLENMYSTDTYGNPDNPTFIQLSAGELRVANVVAEYDSSTGGATASTVEVSGGTFISFHSFFYFDSGGVTNASDAFKVSGGTVVATNTLFWKLSNGGYDIEQTSGTVSLYNCSAGSDKVTGTFSRGSKLFVDGVEVTDEAYGVGWNGSLEVPTKNAIYDKIETITADITSVGDVTTGAAFDGTQGTTLTFYNAGGNATLDYDGTDFSISKPVDLGANALTTTGTITTGDVQLSGDASGVLTLAGINNTNNENLTLDFETTADRVLFGSGTGASLGMGINFRMADDTYITFGNYTSGSDANIRWNTTGNDHLQIGITVGTAEQSGYVTLVEGEDLTSANRSPLVSSANPTFRIYSSDSTEPLDYIEFSHDQAAARIYGANGGLALDASEGRFWFTDDLTGMLQIQMNKDVDQIVLGIDDDAGNQIVIANQANTLKDYDHAPTTDPTLFIHSDTDPDSNNTQWLGLYHNKTDGYITCGTGTINFDNENLTTTGTITGNAFVGVEGTAVESTGEGGGTKFLREDGDGTCSWQAVSTPTLAQVLATGADANDIDITSLAALYFVDNDIVIDGSVDGVLDVDADTTLNLGASTTTTNVGKSGAAIICGESLVSDTANTDDLGSASVGWRYLYLDDANTNAPTTNGQVNYNNSNTRFEFYQNGAVQWIEAGWHGSTTRIKIKPSDFVGTSQDKSAWMSTNGAYITDENDEIVACISIPTGYKATHVMVYASANNNVTVYENEITDGSTATSKGTGACNTEIDITDVTSTATNYLSIMVASSSDNTWGGYVTIAKA